MKSSLCIDLLYLEITDKGPIFSNTKKLLAGMELAKKVGYTAVEFWDWDTRDWKALLAKKKELDLDVAALCAKDRGTLVDPTTHEQALKGLEETIAVAKEFACKNIIIVASNMDGFTKEESKKNILEGLKKMVSVAEKNDVTLVLEPIVGDYFRDSQEPFEMIQEIGSDNLKLLYDIYHYQKMEGNITPTIHKYYDKIGHIHIAGLPNRNEIMTGEINYKYVIKEIAKSGYKGFLGIEYLPTMEKEESARATKEYVESAR